MFGRLVSIDGTEIFVTCSPDTPYSEVLRRAAAKLATEEFENLFQRLLDPFPEGACV